MLPWSLGITHLKPLHYFSCFQLFIAHYFVEFNFSVAGSIAEWIVMLNSYLELDLLTCWGVNVLLVSPPEQDSRFSVHHVWRCLLKQRCWVGYKRTFQTVSGICIWSLPNIYPTFTKSFFISLIVIIVIGPFKLII